MFASASLIIIIPFLYAKQSDSDKSVRKLLSSGIRSKITNSLRRVINPLSVQAPTVPLTLQRLLLINV